MNDKIPSLLRQHDPAAGKLLTSFDRTRILHRAGTQRRTRRGLVASFGLAALMILVVAVATLKHEQAVTPRADVRQIQYATPGGTRIVWTLDPNFHM